MLNWRKSHTLWCSGGLAAVGTGSPRTRALWMRPQDTRTEGSYSTRELDDGAAFYHTIHLNVVFFSNIGHVKFLVSAYLVKSWIRLLFISSAARCIISPPWREMHPASLQQGRSHGGGLGRPRPPHFVSGPNQEKHWGEKNFLFFVFFFFLFFYPSNIFNHFYPSILLWERL